MNAGIPLPTVSKTFLVRVWKEPGRLVIRWQDARSGEAQGFTDIGLFLKFLETCLNSVEVERDSLEG